MPSMWIDFHNIKDMGKYFDGIRQIYCKNWKSHSSLNETLFFERVSSMFGYVTLPFRKTSHYEMKSCVSKFCFCIDSTNKSEIQSRSGTCLFK